jgi:UDP-N-acetylglucosamine 2-epimerase (non-hydrolysing)
VRTHVQPILCVVGARPNFVKIAPLIKALGGRTLPYLLVHTGQHYDDAMSRVFFEELGIPAPHIDLGVGSGSHAEQTARVMLEFEPIVAREKPASVIVVGDVNSTLACALTAKKRGVPVAHVEAGLRSFDRDMPEEINRVLTDALAELCLTPSADADRNLLREGIALHRIVRVGNIMIDTLLAELPRARASGAAGRLGIRGARYGVVTLHRPANVDDPVRLRGLLEALGAIARELTLVMPMHPRTRARCAEHGLELPDGLKCTPPLGYHDTIGLCAGAQLVLTDSGGLQEETTVLGVPCLTLRNTTERPVTIELGTNQLCGTDPNRILLAARAVLDGQVRPYRVPELWDGHTADRVLAAMAAADLLPRPLAVAMPPVGVGPVQAAT